MASRIKRNGQRGRIPNGARYVGRPSIYGNPWPVEQLMRSDPTLTRDEAQIHAVLNHAAWLEGEGPDHIRCGSRIYDRKLVLARITDGDLTGRDLACSCDPDQPCHADTLIALAAGQVRHA